MAVLEQAAMTVESGPDGTTTTTVEVRSTRIERTYLTASGRRDTTGPFPTAGAGQVLGRLPWLAAFFLRSRRLRARLDMVPPLGARGMRPILPRGIG